MPTEITSVRVSLMRGPKGLTGFASCVIDGKWAVDNLAVYSKGKGYGYRILYPAKKLSSGQDIGTFYPITREAGDAMEKAISDETEKLMLERYAVV